MTLFNISKKTLLILILLLVFAAVSRGCFALNLPLSGDEVGVGVLQATGQSLLFEESLPVGNVPISEIKKYVNYSTDHGVQDVVHSLQFAGMHPPFYYLLLHYIIQFLDNSVITLRLFSLVFSVLSIAAIFLLGKAMHSEFLGLLSALFLTLSAYCLQYSVMVRPYPLLMFLSLFSTLLIYMLAANNKFHFKSPGTYLYILISVIGLYTMYHYIFVIFFQAVFVILSLPKNAKRLLLTTLIYILTGLLYLPWLPFLRDQLDVVNSAGYYFHGQSNALIIIFETIRNNFLRFPFQDNSLDAAFSLTNLLLFPFILVVFLIGCMNALYHKESRLFFISLLFYLASHFVGDWLLDSKTLIFEKFQFFLAPMFFLLFAFGFVKLPTRYFVRTGAIAVFSVMLVLSSVTVYKDRVNFDGPEIVKSLNTLISSNMDTKDDRALVIVNTATRRLLLSLAHSINTPVDIVIITGQDTTATLGQITNPGQYNTVFVVNLLAETRSKPQLSNDDFERIEDFFSTEELTIITPLLNSPGGTLTQFTKSTTGP